MTISEFIKKNKEPSLLVCMGAVKTAEKMMFADEQLIYATIKTISTIPVNGRLGPEMVGIKNKLTGVVVVTDKRIFFCSSILGMKETKQINLKDVLSIDDAKVFIRTAVLRVKGITDMLVIDGDSKHLDKLKNAILESKNKCEHVDGGVNKTSQMSMAQQLLELKGLLDKGIITQSEFNEKKRKILDI